MYGPFRQTRSVFDGISVKLKPEFQKLEIEASAVLSSSSMALIDGVLGLLVVVDAESVLADDVRRQAERS